MCVNRMKQIRRSKGISQDFIADELGVTQASYSKWENNKTRPSYETLCQIASLLGVSVPYLMGDAPAAAADPIAPDDAAASAAREAQHAPLTITDVAAFTDRTRAEVRSMTVSDRALIAHMLRNCAEYIESTAEDSRADGISERDIDADVKMAG